MQQNGTTDYLLRQIRYFVHGVVVVLFLDNM